MTTMMKTMQAGVKEPTTERRPRRNLRLIRRLSCALDYESPKTWRAILGPRRAREVAKAAVLNGLEEAARNVIYGAACDPKALAQLARVLKVTP